MGLFDSLLGEEGRKFIKRKDSDAGETGSFLFLTNSNSPLSFLSFIFPALHIYNIILTCLY